MIEINLEPEEQEDDIVVLVVLLIQMDFLVNFELLLDLFVAFDNVFYNIDERVRNYCF